MVITKENWLVVAVKSYENPNMEEIQDDLQNFPLFVRGVNKIKSGKANKKYIRTTTNRFIMLTNSFGSIAPRLILSFSPEKSHPSINAFLKYFGYYAVYPETKDKRIDKFVLKCLEEELE